MTRKMPLARAGLAVFCWGASSLLHASVAERYYPSWTNELSWANGEQFARPQGAQAWLEENYVPWWQSRVVGPIADYSADRLPAGHARLDAALEAGITLHRPRQSWDVRKSPTGIDELWQFTRGSPSQEPQTARGYQNAFFDLGIRPLQRFSADIGAEVIGNDDQRFWFPVSDEHRMAKDDRRARIVRGEAKYDDGNVLLRGFAGEPVYGWLGQNDLFGLLPAQLDTEYYRRQSGTLTPRGGEMRVKSPWGTLQALGGSEIRWGYGPSAFAKYDFPAYGSWENSLVYRNEAIPWTLRTERERRWAMSYNSSYGFSERLSVHGGLMYQPFRLDRPYQDVEDGNQVRTRRTGRSDAMGGTLRFEYSPEVGFDRVGIGYSYLGALAGNKQQVDTDAGKTLLKDWTLSGAYTYRRPIRGPVPLLYEGTSANPGAILSSPRGPDDPVHVWWDNREAHLGSLTLAFDPTPGTPMFSYQRNILEEWNLNPDEDATWTGALQYRLAHYPTNTDRLYHYSEDRAIQWDFTFIDGARATRHPFSSAAALARWRLDRWRVTLELTGGEAAAGSAIAYRPQEDYYKPTTIFFNSGMTVEYRPVKVFFRYAKDVWGPADYHTSFGWAYHRIYQAGLSVQFLKQFESGFRYSGTRMSEQFIGEDTGAFNEYRWYLTWHFGWQGSIAKRVEAIGRPLPRSIPEASLTASASRFTPDGSGPVTRIDLFPRAVADAGLLSWRVVARNGSGQTVKMWEGRGMPPESLRWDGMASDGKPLPVGLYRLVLEASDLYGNDVTSPPLGVTLAGAEKRSYTLETTPEGLRVTLSSLVLFDVDKYDLKPMARQALEQVGELLKAYPDNRLRVSGHTDSSGSDLYNQRLSERRARAVADFLTANYGVAASRLQVVGSGESRPVADNRTPEGRQQNRRVEIDILK